MPDLHITYDYGGYIHVANKPWYAAILLELRTPKGKLRCVRLKPYPTETAAAAAKKQMSYSTEHDSHDWLVVTAVCEPSTADTITVSLFTNPHSILHKGIVVNSLCDACRRVGESAFTMLNEYWRERNG